MSEIEQLIDRYSRFVQIPWSNTVSGAERVWMFVYQPRDERRLRARVTELEIATKGVSHGWELVDLTDSFAEWMGSQEYRDSYFEHPEDMSMALGSFGSSVAEDVKARLEATDDNTVVALLGLGTLYGLYSVSALLDTVSEHVRGRLLALFPGIRDGNNYRLLDAKDGWNYLAIPIDLAEGDS